MNRLGFDPQHIFLKSNNPIGSGGRMESVGGVTERRRPQLPPLIKATREIPMAAHRSALGRERW